MIGQWERTPQYDKRIKDGDDWAGDAWRHHETGEVRWTVVGIDMNKAAAEQVFVGD